MGEAIRAQPLKVAQLLEELPGPAFQMQRKGSNKSRLLIQRKLLAVMYPESGSQAAWQQLNLSEEGTMPALHVLTSAAAMQNAISGLQKCHQLAVGFETTAEQLCALQVRPLQ